MQDRRKEDAKAFESYVRRVMEEKQAPGIAVAVVSPQETLYQGFFGVRDTESGAPIDGNTIFGLASVTKSFTCMSIMQLYDRGILDIEYPVSKYIPELKSDRP